MIIFTVVIIILIGCKCYSTLLPVLWFCSIIINKIINNCNYNFSIPLLLILFESCSLHDVLNNFKNNNKLGVVWQFSTPSCKSNN